MPSQEDLLEVIRRRKEGHRLIANDWGTGSVIFLVINVVLSAITSSSLLKVFDLPDAITVILSILVTVNSSLMAFFKPSEKVEEHRVAIAKYDQANFLNDKLEQRIADIEKESPILRHRTVMRAKKRLRNLDK